MVSQQVAKLSLALNAALLLVIQSWWMSTKGQFSDNDGEASWNGDTQESPVFVRSKRDLLNQTEASALRGFAGVSERDTLAQFYAKLADRKKVKAFPHPYQQAVFNLVRTLHGTKMWPLDVSTPAKFHTDPHWGKARGQPIGRYYLHQWMEGVEQRAMNWLPKGPSKYRCLEIGDGHFIRDTTKRAWKQRLGVMFQFCDPATSLAVDLVDKRADLNANLEDPLGTVSPAKKHLLTEGFDFAVACQVFEHVAYPHKAMRGLRSLIRPGGIVIHSVPFMGNTQHGFDVQRFTTNGVKIMAEQAGFRVLENNAVGNSLTVLGSVLELSADDFTETELDVKDPYNYFAVYSVFKRPATA